SYSGSLLDPDQHITTILHHYLVLVVNAKHHKALTRLLVSQHPLAVERMRYKQRGHRVNVQRDDHRCRFGCNCVETAEHAVFFCKGPANAELETLRDTFMASMQQVEPRVNSVAPWNTTNILDTVCQVAKYVYKVFGIFDSTPMVWPEAT
ncbi:hypothetical protein B0H11DRAFT_2043387, partial [Mycena galericulata]